jgi:holliday junction resolvase YEN1
MLRLPSISFATSTSSGWMHLVSYRHGHTKSPELAGLFARCLKLFELPLDCLFVFDGSQRPKYKRGGLVRGNDHWLTRDWKEMLDALGFSYIEVCSPLCGLYQLNFPLL